MIRIGVVASDASRAQQACRKPDCRMNDAAMSGSAKVRQIGRIGRASLTNCSPRRLSPPVTGAKHVAPVFCPRCHPGARTGVKAKALVMAATKAKALVIATIPMMTVAKPGLRRSLIAAPGQITPTPITAMESAISSRSRFLGSGARSSIIAGHEFAISRRPRHTIRRRHPAPLARRRRRASRRNPGGFFRRSLSLMKS